MASSDRRVRKTRDALHAALVDLIVRRGYDAITVEDILNAADVGRSTFYAHFSNKDALLTSGFERLRADLAGAVPSTPLQSFGFLPALLAHAKMHAGLYRALLGSRGGALALLQFRNVVREHVMAELKRRDIPEARRRLLAGFYCGGILGALETWLASGNRADIDHFLDVIGPLA